MPWLACRWLAPTSAIEASRSMTTAWICAAGTARAQQAQRERSALLSALGGRRTQLVLLPPKSTAAAAAATLSAPAPLGHACAPRLSPRRSAAPASPPATWAQEATDGVGSRGGQGGCRRDCSSDSCCACRRRAFTGAPPTRHAPSSPAPRAAPPAAAPPQRCAPAALPLPPPAARPAGPGLRLWRAGGSAGGGSRACDPPPPPAASNQPTAFALPASLHAPVATWARPSRRPRRVAYSMSPKVQPLSTRM